MGRWGVGRRTCAHGRAVFQEKDVHSGLIGPLLICRANTLNAAHGRQVTVQEFALFFTIFDETKSWYFTENVERNCRAPCHLQMEDPTLKENYRFHGNTSHRRSAVPVPREGWASSPCSTVDPRDECF